jgi:3-deoxy-manno-octulosonate cytidylyltransferase (CMP-KDO synthetase)
MTRIVAIIPARMGSSRFPGKPLAPLLGRPMIEHVYKRAQLCQQLEAVYIATCDDDIRQAATAFGAPVLMTASTHERASDRVAEAAAELDAEIVVMIQGDEPLITPAMIDSALAPLIADQSVKCVNLARRINYQREYFDPNTIKIVMNTKGEALYFSRSPIPAADFTKAEAPPLFKQVCVIPFRRAFLLQFARLEPTPLERAESIDMLRALEHGYAVRLVETEIDTHAVDTEEDLRLVETLMQRDPLRTKYQQALVQSANLP